MRLRGTAAEAILISGKAEKRQSNLFQYLKPFRLGQTKTTMMLLKRSGNNNNISDHRFACNRRRPASEATALHLLHTFEKSLRLRLLSLVPAPETLTLPYLSRSLDALASTHADAGDLLSDPSAVSSYLDTSILLLDACNAILVEIERLRHGGLHLRLASHLLLNGGSNAGKARASVHEWEKLSAGPTSHGAKGLLTPNAGAVYALETVSWLVAGAVSSAIRGAGAPTARVSGDFAWAGAYNDLAATIGRGGGLEEMSAVRLSVGRLSAIIDGDSEDKTERTRGAAAELEGAVGRMTQGLDGLSNAVDALFRSVMATRAAALRRFPAPAKTCKSSEIALGKSRRFV